MTSRVQVPMPNSQERKSNFPKLVEMLITGPIASCLSTNMVARNPVPQVEGIIGVVGGRKIRPI